MLKLLITLLPVFFLMLNCSRPPADSPRMNEIAQSYVQLMLEIGLYDGDFIDAYYGPDNLKPTNTDKADTIPLDRFKNQIEFLRRELAAVDVGGMDEIWQLRKTYLDKQLVAAGCRVDFLAGKKKNFDEESAAQYDAVAPEHGAAYFDELLVELNDQLPGKGSITQRLADFKADFIIPKDKLDAVFKAAITEARKRTLAHIDLPAGEDFHVEYVTDKAWSAYNWYKGKSYSLIQVNTDLPIYIERAIDLACHEGYPGHHVYNALLEKNLVDGRGWVEISVYPLFSPQSLIAEGSANFGIEVAFPGVERVEFERKVLFPLAGFDPAQAEKYYAIAALTHKLSYAGNEAARQFLDGKIERQAAIDWLVKYALMTPDRAAQRLRFIEKYRSYVINYNHGQDLVRAWIEKQGGTADQPEKRWQIFQQLLSHP